MVGFFLFLLKGGFEGGCVRKGRVSGVCLGRRAVSEKSSGHISVSSVTAQSCGNSGIATFGGGGARRPRHWDDLGRPTPLETRDQLGCGPEG